MNVGEDNEREIRKDRKIILREEEETSGGTKDKSK